MSIWKVLLGKGYAEGISDLCLPILCYVFRKTCIEPTLFLRVNSQFTTISP